MTPELERLIDAIVADGVVTDQERAVLHRRAADLGIRPEEVDILVEAKLTVSRRDARPKKPTKCPSCGAQVSGLARVCQDCGHVLEDGGFGGAPDLHQTLAKLEHLLAELKAIPLPGTPAYQQEALARMNANNPVARAMGMSRAAVPDQPPEIRFEKTLAEVERERRIIGVYFGADALVGRVLAEIDAEISSRRAVAQEGSQRQERTNRKTAIVAVAVLVLMVVGMAVAVKIADSSDRDSAAKNDKKFGKHAKPIKTKPVEGDEDGEEDSAEAKKSGASVASGKGAAAKEAPVPPTDPIDALVASAISEEDVVKRIGENSWAFFPANTQDCKSHRLDIPDVKDDFDQKKLIDNRSSIIEKANVVGRLVVMKTEALVQAKETTDTGWNAPIAELSGYDFADKSYQFSLRAGESNRWPLVGGRPSASNQPWTSTSTVGTGLSVGGKELKVKQTESHDHYFNADRITYTIPIEPAEAEVWQKKGAQLSFVSVQRFKSLGYHRACKYSCMKIFGSTVCGDDDVGLEKLYETEPVAFRLKIGGKLIAQKLPDDIVGDGSKAPGQPGQAGLNALIAGTKLAPGGGIPVSKTTSAEPGTPSPGSATTASAGANCVGPDCMLTGNGAKEPPKSSEPAGPPAGNGGAEFDKAAAKSALSSIAYKDCGSGGPGKVQVTFGPSGSVSSAVVSSGDYDGATKSCIQNRFKGAKVPAFGGDSKSFGWSISL